MDLQFNNKFNRKGTEKLLSKHNTLKGRDSLGTDYKSFRTMRKDGTLPPLPRMSKVSEHVDEEMQSNEGFKAPIENQFETGGTKQTFLKKETIAKIQKINDEDEDDQEQQSPSRKDNADLYSNDSSELPTYFNHDGDQGNYTNKECRVPLFYPDSSLLGYWNIFMMVVLILTCIITPLRLAFLKENETETQEWMIV